MIYRMSRANRKPNKIKEFICEECGIKYQLKKTPNKGRKHLCKNCLRIEINKRARAAKYHINPEYRLKNRAWRLENLYKLSLEDFDALSEKQNNVCAICKKTNYNGRPLVVDHSHISNKIRGLLCDKCNRAIGALEDDPKRLQNAILYLIRAEDDKSWDRYFINIASLISTRSKDLSTQVGAVLVKDGVILSTGYNGFPRGCDDNNTERNERPLKYKWVVHAEENALLNAGREGVSTKSATMYVTPIRPCSGCMKAMIQCGVKRIVCQALFNVDKWDKEFEISSQMMEEAGVDYVEIN